MLTIDGQGEDESASLSEWTGQSYRPIGAIRSPDSIGILYGMVTDFLGMRAGWDEYKVMAMAREGDPERFRQAFDRLVCLEPDGTYRTHRTAMVFRPGYCDRMLARFFQVPPRQPTAPVERIHFDLAAALQAKTREIVFHLLGHLRKHTASRNLCMAGGVALNSVINGEVLRSGLFDSVWVPPAPGDHGGALGAALFLASCTGSVKRPRSFTAFLGPGYDDRQLLQALESFERPSTWTRPVSLAMDVARALARQQIVGWFQGRMEYGPRALGHRSILASPADRAMRDRINDRIKHREGFRPFGCAVPQERAAEIFEVGGPSPFMQFVVPVRESWRARLGAVDFCGTCRIQTVAAEDEALLHELLFAFGDLTGAPVLLNTSFNACDDPIVCTPDDALRTWWRTELDILVLGPYLVRRGRG